MVLGLPSKFLVLSSESCSLFQKDGISLRLSRSLSLLPATRILGVQRPFFICPVSSFLSLSVFLYIRLLKITLWVFLINFLGVYVTKQKLQSQMPSGFVEEILWYIIVGGFKNYL